MGQCIFTVFGDGHKGNSGDAELFGSLHHLFVLAGYGNQDAEIIASDKVEEIVDFLAAWNVIKHVAGAHKDTFKFLFDGSLNHALPKDIELSGCAHSIKNGIAVLFAHAVHNLLVERADVLEFAVRPHLLSIHFQVEFKLRKALEA